ncbi:MAG: hypothetical protein ACLP22_19900 [Solirubrobacteraceae bacterium]
MRASPDHRTGTGRRATPPAAQFFSRVLAHPADPGLRDDLAALEPDTLDDL